MGSCLLEKAQVLHGGQGRESPSFMGSLSRKKRLGLSASQSFGLRWQVLGEAAVTVGAAQYKAQLAGVWAARARGWEGLGRQVGPQSPALCCCSASLSLWPQHPHLQTAQRPPPLSASVP